MTNNSELGWRGRVRCWWRGRQWRLLARALPALLAALGVLITLIVCLDTPAREREARYLEQARAAYKARDYRKALTCYERLAPTAAGRPEVQFGLARAAEANGDLNRAALLIAPLAPTGRRGHASAQRRGYAPAHFWVARQLLLSPTVSADALDAAETHLLCALDGELEDPETAHGLLGQVYVLHDRLDDAEPHLLRAAKARPQMRMWLARLFALRKDREGARREAESVVRHFRGRAEADLADHQARLLWADALTFLEDFPAAIAVLEAGAATTSPDLYRPVLARVYLAWYDTRAHAAGGRPAEQVTLLEKGLRYDPVNRDLLNSLLEVLRQEGAAADETRQLLKRLAAKGQGSAAVHFVLGSDAWRRGRTEEACVHLDRAYQLDPGLAVVGNNLAWMLSQGASPDLPQALGLINRVLERSPDEANFRDTRGQILVKMGRWKEALPDLEAALADAPDRPTIHEALAVVYEKLGDPDLAAEHRRPRQTPTPRTP